MEPLPGCNAFIPSRPEEKVVNYPARPVDSNTHFEGTASIQPPQQAPANAVAGNMPGSHMPNRNVPRQMPMPGMQRVQPQGIAPYNISSQAGMGGGLNPGGMPMQRGVGAQQQQQLRRKDPGILPGYPPQQKSRRF